MDLYQFPNLYAYPVIYDNKIQKNFKIGNVSFFFVSHSSIYGFIIQSNRN